MIFSPSGTDNLPDVPFVLLNLEKVKSNIRKMASKAEQAGVVFRPHFKTHQCAEIGKLFKDEGINRITVSSLSMAQYFAVNGWEDITVAVPVNIREIDKINALSEQINLGILVDNLYTADFLKTHCRNKVTVWIKIDCGYKRAGIPWGKDADILKLANAIGESNVLSLKGILTHAGNTYAAPDNEGIVAVFNDSVIKMVSVRDMLSEKGISGLLVSVGDTPGCVLSENFQGVDEIRPGNFVFFDAMMLSKKVCSENEIAIEIHCPVTGIYPERGEVVIYGGAVHFGKESLSLDGQIIYGVVKGGGNFTSISQEHGIIQFSASRLQALKIGDFVSVYPVHSCLTADLFDRYFTLSGEELKRL